jgi:hypothetical protein
MSEQENQLPAVIEQPAEELLTITHRAAMFIGEGKDRQVIVHRLSNAGFQFEWIKPDEGNGAASVSTKFCLSHEALEATLSCLFGIDEALRAAEAIAMAEQEVAKEAEA